MRFRADSTFCIVSAISLSSKRAKRFVGQTLPMLVEGLGEDEDGNPVIAGRTYREAPEVDGLVFASGTATPGARVLVHIDEAADYDLFGTLV